MEALWLCKVEIYVGLSSLSPNEWVQEDDNVPRNCLVGRAGLSDTNLIGYPLGSSTCIEAYDAHTR